MLVVPECSLLQAPSPAPSACGLANSPPTIFQGHEPDHERKAWGDRGKWEHEPFSAPLNPVGSDRGIRPEGVGGKRGPRKGDTGERGKKGRIRKIPESTTY